LPYYFSLRLALHKFSGYYDSATGTNYTLKTQLYNIIAMLTTDMVDYIPSTNRLMGSFLRKMTELF
jgi:hypothetical protein